MALELIGIDWNDTLIKQTDEGPFFEYIGMRLLSEYLPRRLALAAANAKKYPEYAEMIDIARKYDGLMWRFHPVKVLKLAKVKSKLKAMLDEYRKEFGDDPNGEQRELVLREMYKIYNEEVIDGLPIDFVDKAAMQYAKEIARQKIHKPTMDSLIQVKQQNDMPAVIISSAYIGGIRYTLLAAGLKNFVLDRKPRQLGHFVFDDIIGNGLDAEGKIIKGFKLNIYSNKDDVLKDELGKYRANPENAAYIGDDPFTDGPAMSIVGRPVVSLLATDKNRQALAREYKARTPRTQAELFHDLITD